MTYVNRQCELCGRELVEGYSNAVCPVCKQEFDELKAAQASQIVINEIKREQGSESEQQQSEVGPADSRGGAHSAEQTRRSGPVRTVLLVIASAMLFAFIVFLMVVVFGPDGIITSAVRKSEAQEAAAQKAAMVQETRKMTRTDTVLAPKYAVGDRLMLAAEDGPAMAYDSGDPKVAVATSESAFYDMMVYMYADDNVGLQQMLVNWRMQVVSPGREVVILGAYKFSIPSIPDVPEPFVYEVRVGRSSTTHWVHQQSLVPMKK